MAKERPPPLLCCPVQPGQANTGGSFSALPYAVAQPLQFFKHESPGIETQDTDVYAVLVHILGSFLSLYLLHLSSKQTHSAAGWETEWPHMLALQSDLTF